MALVLLGASCQLNLNIFVVYLKQTNRCGRLYDVLWGTGDHDMLDVVLVVVSLDHSLNYFDFTG